VVMKVIRVHAVDGVDHAVVRKSLICERFQSSSRISSRASSQWSVRHRVLQGTEGPHLNLAAVDSTSACRPNRKGKVQIKDGILYAPVSTEGASRSFRRFVRVKSTARQSMPVLDGMVVVVPEE
jgi:hypothetical protein